MGNPTEYTPKYDKELEAVVFGNRLPVVAATFMPDEARPNVSRVAIQVGEGGPSFAAPGWFTVRQIPVTGIDSSPTQEADRLTKPEWANYIDQVYDPQWVTITGGRGGLKLVTEKGDSIDTNYLEQVDPSDELHLEEGEEVTGILGGKPNIRMHVLIPTPPEMVANSEVFTAGQGIGVHRIPPISNNDFLSNDFGSCLGLWKRLSNMDDSALREAVSGVTFGGLIFGEEDNLAVSLDKDMGKLSITATDTDGFQKHMELFASNRNDPRAAFQILDQSCNPIIGAQYAVISDGSKDFRAPYGRVLAPTKLTYGNGYEEDIFTGLQRYQQFHVINDGGLCVGVKEADFKREYAHNNLPVIAVEVQGAMDRWTHIRDTLLKANIPYYLNARKNLMNEGSPLGYVWT